MSARVAAVRQWLAGVDGAGLSDRERVDLIAELEQLKGAASAAQARTTDELRRSRQEAAPQDAVRSVGSEVALARRESPALGDRFVGLSRALVREMPHTMRALTDGVAGERHAVAMVRATATLSVEDRAEVDRRVGPLLDRLSLGAAARAAAKVAAELDAASVVRRMEEAARSRRVTVRPAPDGMAYLTVLTPLREAVGAFASLRARAAAVVGGQCPDEAPDGRGLGAVMSDTATQLMSGRAVGQVQPVEVHLVMTDTALFGPTVSGGGRRRAEATAQTGASPGSTDDVTGAGPLGAPQPSAGAAVGAPWQDAGGGAAPAPVGLTAGAVMEPAPAGLTEGEVMERAPEWPTAGGVMEPARIPGHGSVPAPVARQWIRDAGDASVWLRRLYTTPDGRDLVAMDSRRRVFTGLLRRMLVLRDDRCTTPWCDGLVAHADHAVPVREGSATDFDTGNGRCARCNYGKEAPGWRNRVVPAGPGNVASGDPRGDGPPGGQPHGADLGAGGAHSHELEVTTPSGRRYRSVAPPLLGWGWQPAHPQSQAGSDGLGRASTEGKRHPAWAPGTAEGALGPARLPGTDATPHPSSTPAACARLGPGASTVGSSPRSTSVVASATAPPSKVLTSTARSPAADVARAPRVEGPAGCDADPTGSGLARYLAGLSPSR